MKKLIIITCLASAVALTAGTAMADSINGRLGVTGKVGFLLPADNNDNHPDAGFVGAAGLIYGITDNIAADVEVSRTSFDAKRGEFGITNVALGGQYRFALSNKQFVPFLGAGLDILVSDYDHNRDVDTTVGVHAAAGVDYFIARQFALTAETRLVVAPDARIIEADGRHINDFNPSSFSGTVGLRYFFN